jgi:hypothetical protein
MSAAAPDGAPPRRIKNPNPDGKTDIQKLPAPPCPGGALAAGTPHTFFPGIHRSEVNAIGSYPVSRIQKILFAK